MPDNKQSKVGELSWTEVKPNETGPRESVFLNMREEGKYKMRIASKPFQYYCHWVEDKNGKRRKVNATLDGNDPVCISTGKGPQLKWLIKVLFRNPDGDTQLKILDAGSQIMGQIKRLHEDVETFGDVSKYDIVIVKGPKGANPLYTVQATGTAQHPQPLTKEEIQMVKDSADPQSDGYIDVDRMCEAWTAERIQAVLDGKDPREAAQVGSGTVQKQTKEETNLLNDDEDEEDFLDLEL